MSLTFKEYYNTLKYGSYIAVTPDDKTKEKIKEIIKKLKIKNPIPIDDIHVTLMYSEGKGIPEFFPYPDAVYEGIGRDLEIFGDVLVIRLISPDLHQRFEDLCYRGFKHTFDPYTPHISLSYNYSDEKLDSTVVEDVKFEFSNEYHIPIDPE